MYVYLDTNCVLWLYAGESDRFTPVARGSIERNDLLISPVVLLELQYLFEREKITAAPEEIIGYLGRMVGSSYCRIPYLAVIEASLRIGWTRDPFDRLIVAQAAANKNAGLISADRLIRQKYPKAVW